jgi:hypothetical protein
MTPPIWLDDTGQRVPTRPCSRCGREIAVHSYRLEHFRLIGWQLYRAVTVAGWCGHGQEFIPLPAPAGRVQLVPIVGKAS